MKSNRNSRRQTQSSWESRLPEALTLPFIEIGDAVCIGDRGEIARHARHYGPDTIGLEAFVNHLHMRDITPDWAHERRTCMTAVAHTIALAWATRLLPLLRSRTALFFVGGRATRDVSVRFHIERANHPAWLNVSDSALLQRERMVVYRLTPEGLVRIPR